MHQQPVSEMDRLQACAAMVTCPTGSIRTYAPDPLAKIATKGNNNMSNDYLATV